MKHQHLKISIITPSYNQGKYIEQTIQSVLSQKYPNLEYIVIDGGSTDNTLSILKKYTGSLRWLSAKDRGQSDAINKGLHLVTGDIVAYINSDDYYLPGSFRKVEQFFLTHKEAKWLTGKCRIINDEGTEVRKGITVYKEFFLEHLRLRHVFYIIQFISQPAVFWKREIMNDIGFIDEDLNYSMDYDYWLRIWRKYRLHFLPDYLANYRVHSTSKAVSSPETQFNTAYEIVRRYTNSKLILFVHRLHLYFTLKIYRGLLIRK